ncbi:MAG TPA: MerR family transcriptional regulator [Candidatus Acidoferrales bacterium]|nr:MerR family transcriptional regulator [Candidatus Acidoferrales bacterium]
MFKIAAFAGLAGVSAKVLRDYDRAGLFRPAWVDAASGYRRYTPAQLPALRRILALRDLGLGLEEIARLVREGADLQPVLDRRRAELEAARREVERRLATLGISMTATGDVVVRDVPAELVATLDVAGVGGDIGTAFHALETAVRDAGVRAARPPGLLEAEPAEVFVAVRRAAAGLVTRRLPAIRAATILHQGGYEGLPAARAALAAWLVASGLRATGPSRILYLQFGAEADLRLPAQYLVERSADLVTELQVPIG